MSNNSVWTWKLKDLSDSAFNKLDAKFKKIDKSVDHLEGNAMGMADNVEKSTGRMKGGFKSLGQEIPIVGRAMNLMRNPVVLTGAAIGGLGLAMYKAGKAAAEFDNNFLELKNLNLDKTTAQIDRLRDSVLDLSFEKGLDPQKTTKAFFDVQSATGKYGEEVKKIVGEVGVFARTMKADYNTSIEGAAKAMGTFQFGAGQLDDFLASSFKTVQVGITTFDQLAQVQTEYAGSAAAAGQGFNEANKLFAVFSKSAKSVDIAATLTKTAFQDLAKKSTLKGLEKIGVNVFDASGKMRKLDGIVKDLVPKLGQMSDSDFSKLKEEIGGSEGLRGLMDQLKNSGAEVLDTFKAFDDTDFDFDKALANANGDLNIMNDIISNKLQVAWIKFGDAIMPMLIKMKSIIISMLDGLGKVSEFTNAWFDRQGTADQKFAKYSDQFKNDRNQLISSYEEKRQGLSIAEQKGLFEEMIYKNIKETNAELVSSSFVKKFSQGRNKAPYIDAFSKKNAFAKENGALIKFIESKKGTPEYEKLFSTSFLKDHFIKEIDKKQGQTENIDALSTHGSGGSSSNKTALTGITGAADRVRNVTVNIQNLVKDFIVNAADGTGLGELEIMQKIEEVLVRAVRDAELTLSTD